jgi:hypothetical protein
LVFDVDLVASAGAPVAVEASLALAGAFFPGDLAFGVLALLVLTAALALEAGFLRVWAIIPSLRNEKTVPRPWAGPRAWEEPAKPD